MLVGSSSQVGEAMVNAPELRAISFTGSNKIGGELYVKAARRGAKVTCEMGGKNAVIVMPDADLDKAATAIHGGAFGSTGQRCTATSRVIAHPDIKKALVDRLVAAAEKIRLGPGLDAASDMGPSVDERQWKTVMDYIAVGKGEGANCSPAARARRRSARASSSNRRSSTASRRRCASSRKKSSDRCCRSARPHRSWKRSSSRTASVRFDDVDLHVGHHVGDEVRRGRRDRHGARQRADGRRGSAAAVRRHEVHRRRRARDGGRGLNFFTEIKTVFINYSGSPNGR